MRDWSLGTDVGEGQLLWLGCLDSPAEYLQLRLAAGVRSWPPSILTIANEEQLALSLEQCTLPS